MDELKIQGLAENIQRDATLILQELGGRANVLPAGGNLQAALDKGGTIQLEDGATYEGNFKMAVAGTRLVGGKSKLHGPKGNAAAALYVPPGTNDVQATLGEVTCEWDQSVIQLGDADSRQVTREQAPRGIQITAFVPTFRGKRAFFVNSADTLLLDCACLDVWDPAGRDSQAVLILNSPGNVTVRGGHFEAGSEVIMIGGGTTAIPGLDVTGVVVEDVELSRPIEWMQQWIDGTGKHGVKNLFELKDGVNIVLRRSKLTNCWTEAQVGWALVVTPRNNKQIANVLFEDLEISNVGGGMNMLPADDTKESPMLHDLTLRRVNVKAQSGKWGNGRYLTWCGGATNVNIEAGDFEGPNQSLYAYKGRIWNPDGTQSPMLETRGLRFVGNRLQTNTYGYMAPNAYGASWQTFAPDGVISNNTFHGATATRHRPNLPADNIYISEPLPVGFVADPPPVPPRPVEDVSVLA